MYPCANVQPLRLIFYFLLLLTVTCLPQSFDVRMLSFLSHYSIPVLWWVYDATVEVILNFFPIHVIMCKHLWLAIFCAHALVSLLCLRYGPCVCNKSSLLYYCPVSMCLNLFWFILGSECCFAYDKIVINQRRV